jgi:hypothetical protein
MPSIQIAVQEQGMNAPTNIDPVPAHSDSDVIHWLTNETRDERFIDNIFNVRFAPKAIEVLLPRNDAKDQK